MSFNLVKTALTCTFPLHMNIIFYGTLATMFEKLFNLKFYSIFFLKHYFKYS